MGDSGDWFMFQQFGPEQLPDFFFSGGGEARLVLILHTRETVGRIFGCFLSGRLHPHFPLWEFESVPST